MRKFLKGLLAFFRGLLAWWLFVFASANLLVVALRYFVAGGMTSPAEIPGHIVLSVILTLCFYGWWKLK